MSQQCSLCGIIKPLENFSWRKDQARYRKDCKLCQSEKSKRDYRTNPQKRASAIAKAKKYYIENWEKRNRQRNIWLNKNKNKWKIYRKKYFLKYKVTWPERIKANNAVNNAIKSGKLQKPLICPQCGKSGLIHGHHYLGYNKEHWLDVEWLCPMCHNGRSKH